MTPINPCILFTLTQKSTQVESGDPKRELNPLYNTPQRNTPVTQDNRICHHNKLPNLYNIRVHSMSCCQDNIHLSHSTLNSHNRHRCNKFVRRRNILWDSVLGCNKFHRRDNINCYHSISYHPCSNRLGWNSQGSKLGVKKCWGNMTCQKLRMLVQHSLWSEYSNMTHSQDLDELEDQVSCRW